MKFPKYTIMAGLLCGLSAIPAVAAAVDEVTTTHNTTDTAQVLTVDGSDIQVNGTIEDGALTDANGNPLPDVDVYAIDVQASDVLTFDINCGANCGTGSVDTKLTLFDSADMTTVWQLNDDGPFDSTTGTSADPLIQNVSLGHDGTIYVLVTYWGTNITTDSTGTISASTTDGGGQGDYQLVISGATAAPVASTTTSTTTTTTTTSTTDPAPVATTDTGDQVVNVNINPFYKGPWPRINPRSRGLLPVAILSQDGFDPADVDLESLRFGANGDEDSLVRCQRIRRDMNRDGVKDLLCFFSMRRADFNRNSDSGTLNGLFDDGETMTSFTAQAPLKMVPYKRGRHHGNAFGRGNGRRR
jgi:hypothetical protein